MTVQPPGIEPQATPPSPVQDRRAPDRRSGGMRREEDRAQLIRTAIVAATSICGGLVILFLFFWALGAVDIEDAAATAVAAIVLALVWIAGFWYRHRHEDTTRVHHERERRGF